jgi:hypothetical protein
VNRPFDAYRADQLWFNPASKAITDWSPGQVGQIALHPVAGMDRPFTAFRLKAIFMSGVR